MRAVLQITEKSRLLCDGKVVSDCGAGLCILLGLKDTDTDKEADKVIDKILKMRIFPDAQGKLNLSCLKTGADILVVSNFTLYANLSSRRPASAQPDREAWVGREAREVAGRPLV